mmetsp:Transcript_33365/g.74694  ORF Transcript_33365/g.74694 Transcript_33365/m.74694 type:complete len:567 (+) Transcript_33365:24-1724(+)
MTAIAPVQVAGPSPYDGLLSMDPDGALLSVVWEADGCRWKLQREGEDLCEYSVGITGFPSEMTAKQAAERGLLELRQRVVGRAEVQGLRDEMLRAAPPSVDPPIALSEPLLAFARVFYPVLRNTRQFSGTDLVKEICDAWASLPRDLQEQFRVGSMPVRIRQPKPEGYDTSVELAITRVTDPEGRVFNARRIFINRTNQDAFRIDFQGLQQQQYLIGSSSFPDLATACDACHRGMELIQQGRSSKEDLRQDKADYLASLASGSAPSKRPAPPPSAACAPPPRKAPRPSPPEVEEPSPAPPLAVNTVEDPRGVVHQARPVYFRHSGQRGYKIMAKGVQLQQYLEGAASFPDIDSAAMACDEGMELVRDGVGSKEELGAAKVAFLQSCCGRTLPIPAPRAPRVVAPKAAPVTGIVKKMGGLPTASPVPEAPQEEELQRAVVDGGVVRLLWCSSMFIVECNGWRVTYPIGVLSVQDAREQAMEGFEAAKNGTATEADLQALITPSANGQPHEEDSGGAVRLQGEDSFHCTYQGAPLVVATAKWTWDARSNVLSAQVAQLEGMSPAQPVS